jgi:hypothetical protein
VTRRAAPLTARKSPLEVQQPIRCKPAGATSDHMSTHTGSHCSKLAASTLELFAQQLRPSRPVPPQSRPLGGAERAPKACGRSVRIDDDKQQRQVQGSFSEPCRTRCENEHHGGRQQTIGVPWPWHLRRTITSQNNQRMSFTLDREHCGYVEQYSTKTELNRSM